MTLAEAIAHEDWAASTAHGELAVEHAQMRDWLRELERLRDENARLRSELESVGTAAYLYGRTDLADENAKLLELLTFYLGCLTKGHVNCDSCAFAEGICGHGHKVIDWARALGVEAAGV